MRSSSAPLGSVTSTRSAAASVRPVAPRLRATASSTSAVLERAPHVDVIVPPPNYADLLPSIDEDSQRGFQDYESAAQRMEDLERLSAELLQNLNELNSASEALEATPVPDFYQLQHQEERRAKRAAAREARKTKATAAQGTATSTRPDKADVVRSSGASSAALATSAGPASTSTSLTTYERQGQTRALAAGPSIRSAGPSLPRGPSLAVASRTKTAVAAATSMQAEPSAWAREANAKRAGIRGTRKSASSSQDPSSRSRGQVAGGSGDGTAQFMKKSGGHDLLNGVSEKDLANIVKDALFVDRIKDELRGLLKREPTMAEWAKAVGMEPSAFAVRQRAGQHAKSVMLQANYRLVIAICKKYQHRGMALQDLITEGIRGLLTGVEKFDADKGFRFSTYAHWWIRQAVTRAISSQTREVRMPSHMLDVIARIKHAKAQLVERLNREPTTAEVAAAVDMPPKKLTEIMAMSWQSASLDSAIGADEDASTMKDMLQDERGTPDENLEDTMFGREMDSLLEDLTEREAGVIKLRFGLGSEPVVTLEEIGLRFNLTRERIRQIEAKAIRKLKAKSTLFASILQEYSNAEADADVAPRSSQGTNKSK